MKKACAFLLALMGFQWVCGQSIIPLPQNLSQSHPRLLTTPEQKLLLKKQVTHEEWAKEVLKGIENRINPLVERTQKEPDWVYSRLMMYWKSKATNVYINGGVYAGADGEAPVATVRFGSTRGVGSPYKRPKLEDIMPYMDDTKGVLFHNSSKEGSPLEWVDAASASGSHIESINEEIMKHGKDAAFLYWLTDDTKYATFAYDIFNTYMQGIYYRHAPTDIGNGHAQTLAGYSTFEVIQERILNELSYLYDFLYPYLAEKHPNQLPIYAEAFKKWIDFSLSNGVPHNNWNLHKSKFILRVAMVLEDNNHYADGKGREYYIDYILNKNSARHWSFQRFLAYGYDMENGVWNECPGYAQGVTRDLTNFIRDYDLMFNQNLLPYAPVMYKAVEMIPQYLFPNNMITAFGDTYYGGINTEAMSDMIRLAQKYSNRKSEEIFTSMYKFFEPSAANSVSPSTSGQAKKLPAQIYSFFSTKPLELDETVAAGKLSDYVTPTFYAPNVSWLVQRNGYDDAERGLMISQYGSYGNHAHANGMAMELYGKGYVLGAESGIGSSYFEKPYLEYYSQFPAHNTVMVDGISKYPEMLSNHPFDLLNCYPASGAKNGYYPDMTYSEAYFLEPESRSDQKRLMGIVRTGEDTGYYVDIFRSKKQRKGDKFHDYFYHNLGTELTLTDANGHLLPLQPSDEMGFAGGHLFALDYMWDKQSVHTAEDYQAVWKMEMPDENHIYMNLWMKGYEGREVFSIKSPPCKSYRKENNIPYSVTTEPYLKIAARQHGEAWKHPFVSIFEPTREKAGKSIRSIESFDAENGSELSGEFVGVLVTSESGRKDYIFSSVSDEAVVYQQMKVAATYAVISQQGNDFTLFMGGGKRVQAYGFTMESETPINAVLEYKEGVYSFSCSAAVTIVTTKGKRVKIDASREFKQIKL